ncbi:MAG: GIY-YIG nuclease family protein [Phycisphaerae bacterium]|nr:GIY-YIG nuclease family protein [Phycisphaerae bacterium]
MAKCYFVYMVTNKNNRVLYTGFTNNLKRRLIEHKEKMTMGFTCQYNANKLVYYEVFNDVNLAIEREKQIKGWRREKKNMLVDVRNADWGDLSGEL